MKEAIHPQFYTAAKITCACGNVVVTGATVEEMQTEVCSNCHPFYTGKQRILDTQGKVDTFKKKLEAAAKIKSEVKPKKERKARTAAKK
jgi:large subunit ribosomal protein L31